MAGSVAPRWFASSTVLFREGRRSARRGWTWLLRMGMIAAATIGVLAAWQSYLGGPIDPAMYGVLGRQLFTTAIGFQTFLICAVTPLVVASAVIEERTDGTLELLTMTRLTPSQILFGKLGSRAGITGLLALGCLPAFAFALQLGGVSPSEAAASVLSIAVCGVTVGLVAANVALHGKGLAAPLITVILFIPAAWGVVPAVGGWGSGDDRIAFLSPLFWSMGDKWYAPFIACALWVPTLLALMRMAVVSFRVNAVADRGEGESAAFDRDVWEYDGWVLWASVTTVFALCAVAVNPILDQFVLTMTNPMTGTVIPWFHRLQVGWSIAFTALAVHAGSLLLVQQGSRLVARLDGWITLLRPAETPTAAESEAPAAKRRTAIPPVVRLVLMPWTHLARGRVVGDPIIWRELFTGSSGGATFAALAVFGLGAAVLGLTLITSAIFSYETRLVIGGIGLAFGQLVAMMLATFAFADERRSGTLELLITTPMRPLRITLGKVVAVGLRSVPTLFAAGVLLGSAYTFLPDYMDFDHKHSPLFGMNLWIGIWGVRPLLTAMWVLAYSATLGHWGILFGFRLRPSGTAWPVNLALPVVIGAALGITGALLTDLTPDRIWGYADWVEQAYAFVFPITSVSFQCDWGGVPIELIASTLMWSMFALFPLLVTAIRFRRWASDDARAAA